MTAVPDTGAALPRWPVRKLISYQPWWFLAGALGWLLFHAWPLLPGLIGKAFFDRLQHGAAAGFTLPTILGFVAAAGLARIAVIFGATMTATRWRFGARSLVQRNIVARILRLPGARRPSDEVGRSISTLRDDSEAISMMGDWTFDVIAAVCFAGSSLLILLLVDVRVTLLVMLPLFAVVALTHVIRVRLERYRQRSREATADVTGTIADLVTAARAVQAAGKEHTAVRHLRHQGELRKRASLRDEWLGAWLDAAFASLASVGAGFILLVAASAMREGRFSVGDFVLFSTYLLQVAEYTGFIGYLARSRRQARVSFQRAAELMRGAPPDDLVAHHPLFLAGDPPVAAPPPDPAEPLRTLRVTGLTMRFAGSDRGIRDVTLEVPAGSLTVVTGRIGSGKSTLLRAILGLSPVQSGHIYWNGTEVTDPGSFMVPPRVAYTPQTPALLSGTLRDNVLLGLPYGDDRVTEAVHRAVLERDVAAMPDGLDSEIGVRGLRLSGGQLLRTAAARMLVRRPQLMVFDDLSSGLDVTTEAELWRRIFGSGETCLVVSHRRMVLSRADQIVVLADGAVAGAGTYADLRETCPEFQALLASDEHPAPDRPESAAPPAV